jgi:Ca2+-binding EF-hand superfamily protein
MGGQVQKLLKNSHQQIDLNDKAQDIDQYFHKHDVDDDKYLTNDELKAAILDYIHIHPDYKESLNELLNSLSDNESMTSLETFRLLIKIFTTNEFDEKEYLIDVFKIFDKKCSGQIGASQLCHVFNKLGLNMTKQEAVDIIEDVDEDQDGVIDLEEFIKIMLSK